MSEQRVKAVSRILERSNISDWSRKYWTKVLTQLLLADFKGELVSHSAGLPHLWSTTGHPLKEKLSGGQTYDRDRNQNTGT